MPSGTFLERRTKNRCFSPSELVDQRLTGSVLFLFELSETKRPKRVMVRCVTPPLVDFTVDQFP